MRSISDEAIMLQENEEIPVIYAKRYVPDPKPYSLHDKSNWEGLTRKIKSGKVSFEIDDNFCLKIEGNANQPPHVVGFCKIPDTENNRKRLEFLSKPRYEDSTKIEVDTETGAKVQVPCKVEIPPLYQRLDQSLIKKSALDEMWDKLQGMLEERGLEITQKEQPKPQPVEEARPTPKVIEPTVTITPAIKELEESLTETGEAKMPTLETAEKVDTGPKKKDKLIDRI